MLVAFWLTVLVVSCIISGAVPALFCGKGTFLGSTTTTLSPVIYLIIAVIALAAAAFAATKCGRERIGREVESVEGKAAQQPHSHDNSLGDRGLPGFRQSRR